MEEKLKNLPRNRAKLIVSECTCRIMENQGILVQRKRIVFSEVEENIISKLLLK